MSAWAWFCVMFTVVILAAIASSMYEKYLDHKESMAEIYKDRKK